MKIVIDARIIGSSTGRYAEGLIEGLQKINNTEHEYIVLLNKNEFSKRKNTLKPFKVIEADFPQFTINPFTDIKFSKLLYSLKGDLYHFTMTQQPLLFFGNIVTTTHDLSMIKTLRPGKKNVFVFYLFQNLYKILFRYSHVKSKQIIVPTNYVKKDLLDYMIFKDSSKINVTYEAAGTVDNKKAQSIKALINQQFILYVGNAFPYKNPEKLVDAFELLKKKQPNLQLVFTGKIEYYYQELQKYVKKNNITNVHILGWVSDEELKWLYQNCRVYVFPSLSEGFGLPGLEAMVNRAPVASSDATCLPEVYGDAAQYFNPNDVHDIARTINEILINPKLRSSMIIAGRKQAAKYSWGKMARETLEVYEKVLKEKR